MANFDRELAIELILGGESPDDAIQQATSIGRMGFVVKHFIDLSGDLDKIPDPACVARQLRGLKRVTRGDVERALAACSREA